MFGKVSCDTAHNILYDSGDKSHAKYNPTRSTVFAQLGAGEKEEIEDVVTSTPDDCLGCTMGRSTTRRKTETQNTPIEPEEQKENEDFFVSGDLAKNIVSDYYRRGYQEVKATRMELTSSDYYISMRLAMLRDENIQRLCAKKPVATPVSTIRAFNRHWPNGSAPAYAMQWVCMSGESRIKLLKTMRITLPGFSIRISAAKAVCNTVVFYLKEPLTKLASEFGFSLSSALDVIQKAQDTRDPNSTVSTFIRRAFDDPDPV